MPAPVGVRAGDAVALVRPHPSEPPAFLRPPHAPCCDSARTAAARQQEFFGGIWYKIFSERGPCTLTPVS